MSDVLGLIETSMINDMKRLDIISNNLANVNTAGFKRDIAVSRGFESTFRSMEEASDVVKGENLQVPNLNSVMDSSSGVLKYSGNAFDVAIEGEGFFEIENQNGTFYSRQGTFSLDAGGRLVTSDGSVVKGQRGEMRLTQDEPKIDKQGRVWDGENVIDQLKMVKFVAPRNLVKLGDGLYRADGQAPLALDESEIRLRQGYLETSNVVMMKEMVNMIEVMRHFETSQRVLKGYDDLLDNAIQSLGEF